MKLLKDIWLLIRCYPVAKRSVTAKRDVLYPGAVLTQIAYNETRTALVNQGWADDAITGAIVYIAVSVAYLFSH